MGIDGCRNDPLIVLADGTEVIVLVELDVAPDRVTNIDYVVHGPTGNEIDNFFLTGSTGFPESVEYIADLAPSTYAATATAEVDTAMEVNLKTAVIVGTTASVVATATVAATDSPPSARPISATANLPRPS